MTIYRHPSYLRNLPATPVGYVVVCGWVTPGEPVTAVAWFDGDLDACAGGMERLECRSGVDGWSAWAPVEKLLTLWVPATSASGQRTKKARKEKAT